MENHAGCRRLRQLYPRRRRTRLHTIRHHTNDEKFGKKVGFPLYIKDHHGITLTNEAKSLIPAIRTLLNADEVIHQEIAALNGAQRGTIRIGTYLSCSIHWIPKIIREFQQKHPDIIIQVIEGVEGELADWIQERRVDIGFISLQKKS